jgi:MFS family permease
MYAFRKPFTASGYDDVQDMWGLKFKSAIVIAQVLGYTLSKFIGIKVVSEMGRNKRGLAILALIAISEVALLGFAVVPVEIKFLFLFLNGIPLGMVWGLVFSFLEGRRYTELMGAGLCTSFIFASGFVKTVGKFLMVNGVSEFWMPAATGLVFALPMVFFVWMLGLLPNPNAEDVALRTERLPMKGPERKAFFKKFAFGLTALIIFYVALTAFRDFRDNFMAELLTALGFGETPGIFTATEVPVTIGVLVLLAFLMFIKNNMRALMINHIIIAFGALVVGASTWLFHNESISAVWWIILTGFGAYTSYIPFNCILFERLIAAFKYPSNAGFLIYLADAFGYLGSVTVLLYKDFFVSELDWVTFFTYACYGVSGSGILFTTAALVYFQRKKNEMNG